MSYKMQEYTCNPASDCPNGKKIFERFIERGLEDFEECEICHRPLKTVISATKGFVMGSENKCSGQFNHS